MKVCSVCQRCYEDEVVSCVEENHKSFDFERPGGREIINGFRLDSLLKSDATGKTYRAANIALDQSCLVKIMTAPDDQGSKERFLEQAQLLAAVNHPNLVPVYQSGVLPSGELFVITEETSGQTLRDCLNHGSLVSEVTAVQIARQAAEGLEAIHAAGMTHLNINPDNIILTSDLEHRLLVKLQNPDFGGFNQKLIISPTSNPELRLNGLRYFSPEQCDGQATDAQTDIYSLGIVLYELLAGAPPFEAADAATLIEQQKTIQPAEIKIRNFDIRALLTYTLMDSLQKIPRLRLKKANAFARQLRHIEQLATHLPTPPPVVQTAPVTNKVVTAAPPKIQNFEAPTPTNGFAIPVETRNEVPQPFEPQIVEAAPAEFVVETPIPASEEPVAGTIFPETEVVRQAESVAPEPTTVETTEITDVPLAAAASLVEWEQPEDIPSEGEVLEVRRTEFIEPDFSTESFSDDDEVDFVHFEPESRIEIVIESDESDESGESSEIVPERTASVPLFAQFADGQPARVPLGNRMPLIGGGLVLLIICAVIAVSLISRESQTVYLIEHPVPKSPPAEQLLTEPEEAKVVPEAETTVTETAKTEDPMEKTETPGNIELPNYQPPDVKDRPTLISSAPKRSEQPQAAKDVSAAPAKQAGARPQTKPAGNGAVKQKPFENVTIYIKPAPATPKTDGSTRPRVVQAPAAKKRRSMPF